MRGKTNHEKIMAQRIPPMTALASGRELSEPVPWEMDAGRRPMAAQRAVITTGPMRECKPRLMLCRDCLIDRGFFLGFCLNTVISKTPSRMQMPNIPCEIIFNGLARSLTNGN